MLKEGNPAKKNLTRFFSQNFRTFQFQQKNSRKNENFNFNFSNDPIFEKNLKFHCDISKIWKEKILLKKELE